jgi:hypothetical protein
MSTRQEHLPERLREPASAQKTSCRLAPAVDDSSHLEVANRVAVRDDFGNWLTGIA